LMISKCYLSSVVCSSDLNFYKLFSVASAHKIQYVTNRLKSVLFGFLKGQFLVSLIIFSVSLIGLFIIVPEYALIMSMIIWLIDRSEERRVGKTVRVIGRR